jgi:cytochrome c oxidase subunit 2
MLVSRQRGEEVFMSNQCALCHTIRGTGAQGRIGPDLTHVGGRLGIAANSLPNDVASFEAWVTHAQSLKPYSQMPNITAFTGEDIRALVTYLRDLE